MLFQSQGSQDVSGDVNNCALKTETPSIQRRTGLIIIENLHKFAEDALVPGKQSWNVFDELLQTSNGSKFARVGRSKQQNTQILQPQPNCHGVRGRTRSKT